MLNATCATRSFVAVLFTHGLSILLNGLKINCKGDINDVIRIEARLGTIHYTQSFPARKLSSKSCVVQVGKAERLRYNGMLCNSLFLALFET